MRAGGARGGGGGRGGGRAGREGGGKVSTVGEEGRNGRVAVVTTPVRDESGKGAFWPLRTQCAVGQGLCPAGGSAAAVVAWLQGIQLLLGYREYSCCLVTGSTVVAVGRLWRLQSASVSTAAGFCNRSQRLSYAE